MTRPPPDEGYTPEDLAAVAALTDPTRRRLYDYVVGADGRVTRDEASAACDLERSLVAYHLDKLVDVGLLTATYARPEGRGGPGAGRPAKWYERADTEISVSVPPRAYQLAAELLTRTLEAASASRDLLARLERSAAELAGDLVRTGGAHDDPVDALLACLHACGFEPEHQPDAIRLRNCPFDRLARDHTQLICHMNQVLLAGLVEASTAGFQTSPDDEPRTCCVALRRATSQTQTGC